MVISFYIAPVFQVGRQFWQYCHVSVDRKTKYRPKRFVRVQGINVQLKAHALGECLNIRKGVVHGLQGYNHPPCFPPPPHISPTPTFFKLGGRVTQTSLFDVLVNQSALAIYHRTDN